MAANDKSGGVVGQGAGRAQGQRLGRCAEKREKGGWVGGFPLPDLGIGMDWVPLYVWV